MKKLMGLGVTMLVILATSATVLAAPVKEKETTVRATCLFADGTLCEGNNSCGNCVINQENTDGSNRNHSNGKHDGSGNRSGTGRHAGRGMGLRNGSCRR